jgi:hypothetical protein
MHSVRGKLDELSILNVNELRLVLFYFLMELSVDSSLRALPKLKHHVLIHILRVRYPTRLGRKKNTHMESCRIDEIEVWLTMVAIARDSITMPTGNRRIHARHKTLNSHVNNGR